MTILTFTDGTLGFGISVRPNGHQYEFQNPIQVSGGYQFDYFDITDSVLVSTITFYGNLTLNAQGDLSAGTVTAINITYTDGEFYQFNLSASATVAFQQGYEGLLAGNDTITGGEFRDFLFGFGGQDTINGGGGNDVIRGGLGNDTLNGGDGYDILSYYDRDTAVTVTLSNTGSGNVTIGTEVDTYTSMEGLEGGNGSDRLTGNADNTDIFGNDGRDIIKGLGGYDYLHGGDGNDKLYGGADNDWLFGEGGDDYIDGGTHVGDGDGVSYYNAASGVTVDLLLQGTAQNTIGDGIDTLVNIEKVEGSMHHDTLSGHEVRNILNGLDGDDAIFGYGGNDLLIGGQGRDTINGGDGFDWSNYEDATVGVVVDLNKQGTFQNTRGQGYDKLVSIENLFGSDLNDKLYGDANGNVLEGWYGNDTLLGRAGSDVLIGRFGNDIMTGGANSDVFVFYAGEAGNDKILDFDVTGTDRDTLEFYGIFTDKNDFMSSGVNTAAGFKVTLETGATILFSDRTGTQVSNADFNFYE